MQENVCWSFQTKVINIIIYRYLKLTKKSDGEEYSDSMFMCSRVENFKLVIITQLPTPPVEILEQTYIIKIHVPEPFGL